MRTYVNYLIVSIFITFWNKFALALIALAIGVSVWQYTWISTVLLPYLATHSTIVLAPLFLFVTGALSIMRFIDNPEEYDGVNPRFGCAAIFASTLMLVFYIWALMSHVSITVALH